MLNFLNYLSILSLPLIVVIIILFGIINKIDVYNLFLKGAKSGMSTSIKIIPPLVGLLTAVYVFRASGAMNLITNIISPITNLFNIPAEVVPLALLRPISGSASIAMLSEILKENGADSFIGKLASTIMGSTETIFYTLAIYYGSVGIKNARFTLWAALLTDFLSFIFALFICNILWG